MTPRQAMPPTSRNSVELMLDRMGFGFFRERADRAARRCSSAPSCWAWRGWCSWASWRWSTGCAIARRTPPMLDPADRAAGQRADPLLQRGEGDRASVRRILASNWARLEVLVLDDGSTDHTADGGRARPSPTSRA